MIAENIGKWVLSKKYRVSLLSTILFILSSSAISLMPSSLNSIKMVLGIFGYIFLPGILLASLVGLFNLENPGLSLISGFLLQMFNVFAAWILCRILGVINFYVVITISTLLLIVTFSLLLSNHVHVPKKETDPLGLISFKKVDKYLLLSLILYLALASYFQQYAVQPNSDGASYLDIARNVLEKGVFRSNMLAPPYDWGNVLYSTGVDGHMFGYFVFVLFFTFGGVSLFSAKIGLVFSGLLIVLITFLLTRELLGTSTARLASFIVSISAIFLTHSSLIGGPEFTSALFTLLALYLILVGAKSNERALWFLAALSAFVAWYAWYINFYAFLGVLICSAAYFARLKKESVKTNLFISILLFASLIIDDRISSNFGLEKLGFPIPLLSLVMVPLVYLVSIRKNLKLPQLSLTIVSTLIILDFVFLSFLLASPEAQAFESRLLGVGITRANVELTVSILSRAFNINSVIFYWNMYKDGLYQYIGQATILLALVSLVRLKKIKETFVLAIFPLFLALIWSFLVVVDAFQPRYVISASIFFDILVASTIVFIARSATNLAQLNKTTRGAPKTVASETGVKPLEEARESKTDKTALALKAPICVDEIRVLLQEGSQAKTGETASTEQGERVKKRVLGVTILKKPLRIDTKKLIGFLVVMLMLASFVGLTFETYNSGKNIEQEWNLRQKLGWDSVIDWIQSSTSSKDILACIYGDYFAWYTNRQTVFLWPITNKNASVLIDLIRTLRVNYLVVDTAFPLYFSDLSGLYESPHPFLGSTIAFVSYGEADNNVIVYNVTGIAYGNLTTYEFEPAWKISENWAPLIWYGTGNVSMDQGSVRVDSEPIQRSPIAAAATLKFASLTDLSKYSTMEFWTKVPQSSNINVEIYSGVQGQNYYSYSTGNNILDEWTKIIISLNGYVTVQGDPSLQNASKLNFIVAGVPLGETATFWIKDIKFNGQQYVLEQAGP